MAATPRKLAFLLEDFQATSPGQQLLDRFLMGYPVDGALHEPKPGSVSAYVLITGNEPEFDRRPADHGLVVASTAEAAVEGADAVVIAARKPGAVANERLLRIALTRAREGAACFVHGALANSLESARALTAQAAGRGMPLLAGTALGVTWRLPEVVVPAGTALRQGLIVVQGAFPGAEFQALEGLLPFLEGRPGGEGGVRAVRFLDGPAVWRAGARGLWSQDLLAAALSRSDAPQGDAVLDGRTQDLWGLGLVPKLARSPRGWILEHADGLVSVILVLDGVVADFNVAVQPANGEVISAQLFRAPPPAEQHYSRLAAVVERFFASRQLPWPATRALLSAGLLEAMARPASRTGALFATPQLKFGPPQ